MTRLIHCADLHLSRTEREYSFAVLDEILEVARRTNAAYLLFAGDLFDSFADVEVLKAEFRRRIVALPPACRLIAIPGNHEVLQIGANRLNAIDWSPLEMSLKSPYALRVEASFELLLVPFSSGYAEYAEWDVPPKGRRPRIALAHGSVAGMQFTGGDDEEDAGGVFDPDLFARFQCDYVALGHIHGARTETIGSLTVSYPGSARVWRRGESGPRTVIQLDIGESIVLKRIPLTQAGEFRRIELPVALEGGFPDLAPVTAEWGRQDWVEIVASGVIEDEQTLAATGAELSRRYGPLVRRFEINRDRVMALPGIAAQPLARTFLERWREREPAGDGPEREVWLRAREIGLLKIKELLEARR